MVHKDQSYPASLLEYCPELITKKINACSKFLSTINNQEDTPPTSTFYDRRSLLPPESPPSSSGSLEFDLEPSTLKAGTVDELIHALIGEDGLTDSMHFNIFFATYRSFTEPSVVLNKLFYRYESEQIANSKSTSVIQKSLQNMLGWWFNKYPEDFYTPDDDFRLLTSLMDFAFDKMLTDLRTNARNLKAKYRQIEKDGGLMTTMPTLQNLVRTKDNQLRHSTDDVITTVELFDVDEENSCCKIAQQLTYVDAGLFKSLLVYQGLGCVWSKRQKLDKDRYYTVQATIDQFNAVIHRVMTSIVIPDCDFESRARIICKWISVAKELRTLKNFSSLKAVMSALQAEPIHRLKETWKHVDKTMTSLFDQLSAKRNTLDRCLVDGTPTIPYLGSFLTELSMIDQGTENNAADGQVNFEKRRMEFEILAKLRLFQTTLKGYQVSHDAEFCEWFHSLPCLTEKECFDRSLEIEKPTPSIDTIHPTDHIRSKSHSHLELLDNDRETMKLGTLAKSLGNSVFYQDQCSPSTSTPSKSPQKPKTPGLMGSLTRGGAFHFGRNGDSIQKTNKGQYNKQTESPLPTPDGVQYHLARVGLDEGIQTKDCGANYKCIKIENSDRMPDLMSRILEKHLLTDSQDKYCIVQILSKGVEIKLPEKCNPFYAVAPDPNAQMLNLMLRKQKENRSSSYSEATQRPSENIFSLAKKNILRKSNGY